MGLAEDMVIRGNVVAPEGILYDSCVVVRDGLIRDITSADSVTPTLDYTNHFIAPGYIDLHIHGIHGADTMDGTPDAIRTMAKAVLRHGVTSFLPTTVTQSLDATEQSILAVRQVMKSPDTSASAQVIGMHLEGLGFRRMPKVPKMVTIL